ncbi:sorbitol dehydrogenase [Caballeronia hypogeia]|uniref:Sorbitol dehydrogenase n=1 Tax=Caballeronia hypogeia TaxID=1777140 RepID=A0A158C0N0_9BURK|nr:glucose 1-dehydrogenase [Caballeronia hypogeia]SAK75790.1 sorbitol dehydrogenase [Caballeronia hypogeia]
MSKHQSLAGLVVAVTGGGQGIGRAMALRLAEEGAKLAIADINGGAAQTVCDELRQRDVEAIAITVDVTRQADCERMVASVVEAYGRIDMMIANAGVIQVKQYLDIGEEDWDKVFAVNTKGVFLTTQAAARQMRKQTPIAEGRPKGKIVTLSSIAGRYGAGPMAPVIPHYRASKAAVISITQSAAYTFAPDITVNAICPGLVETDMWKLIDQQWTAIENWESGQAWKQRVSAVPLGRPQTADDVAGLAAFLASKDSDYMTGQSLNIEGGLTMS